MSLGPGLCAATALAALAHRAVAAPGTGAVRGRRLRGVLPVGAQPILLRPDTRFQPDDHHPELIAHLVALLPRGRLEQLRGRSRAFA